jgi:hypothetical protein
VHILAMCVADLAAVVSSADVHTAHLGYFIGEPSDLVPFGVGREGKALVRVMVWGGLALDPFCDTAFGQSLSASRCRCGCFWEDSPRQVAHILEGFCFIVLRLSS